MNKTLRLVVVSIILLVSIITLSACKNYGNSIITNDKAQKDKNDRHLTIINETEQVINEVHIYVDEGTEIESAYQKNPDGDNFSITIPKQYEEYDKFKVKIIDRYGLKYEKIVSNVEKNERREVVITKDDYVEQKGDWKRKLDKTLNGD